MKGKHKYVYSTMICKKCLSTFPIPRGLGSQREKGHTKTMYCPMCKEEADFCEIRYKDAYKTLDGIWIFPIEKIIGTEEKNSVN